MMPCFVLMRTDPKKEDRCLYAAVASVTVKIHGLSNIQLELLQSMIARHCLGNPGRGDSEAYFFYQNKHFSLPITYFSLCSIFGSCLN